MVTGFTKFEFEMFSRKDIQQTIEDYKNYKKWFKFPDGIKGKVCKFKILYIIQRFHHYQIMNGKTS